MVQGRVRLQQRVRPPAHVLLETTQVFRDAAPKRVHDFGVRRGQPRRRVVGEERAQRHGLKTVRRGRPRAADQATSQIAQGAHGPGEGPACPDGRLARAPDDAVAGLGVVGALRFLARDLQGRRRRGLGQRPLCLGPAVGEAPSSVDGGEALPQGLQDAFAGDASVSAHPPPDALPVGGVALRDIRRPERGRLHLSRVLLRRDPRGLHQGCGHLALDRIGEARMRHGDRAVEAPQVPADLLRAHRPSSRSSGAEPSFPPPASARLTQARAPCIGLSRPCLRNSARARSVTSLMKTNS